MKRLIMTSIIIASMTYTGFATEKEISNKDYINTLNNYVGEMKENTDIKEGNFISSTFKGVDRGYLIPDINRLEVLKENCEGIFLSMTSIVLEDKLMQSKHNGLVDKYREVIVSLDEVLVSKRKLLNQDTNSIVKFGKLFIIDNTKTYTANEKIEELNKIYKDINKYYQ